MSQRTAPTGTTEPGRAAPQCTRRRFHWVVRVLLTMAGMFVVMLPLIPFAILLQAVFGEADNVPAFLASEALSLLMPVSTILLVWLLMRYVDRRPLREAGLVWRADSLPLLVLGTVVMTGLSVGTTAALAAFGTTYAPVPVPAGMDEPWMQSLDLLMRSLVHAALCEELLFRGYLMQTLPFRSPWVRVITCAAAFGVIHLASQGNEAAPLLYALNAFGFAFLAGAMVVAFRSLWAAVGVHFGVYVATDIARMMDLGEGPAVWLATGVVTVLLGSAVLWWGGRRHPLG